MAVAEPTGFNRDMYLWNIDDKEDWQRYMARRGGRENVIAFLRDQPHPTRLNHNSQLAYASLMNAWLQHEGPLPEPPPTPRQLKRVKDKQKRQMRQAVSTQGAPV